MMFSKETIGSHCCSYLFVVLMILITVYLRVWSCIYLIISMFLSTPLHGIGKKVVFVELLYNIE
jgi:hypothetical protein